MNENLLFAFILTTLAGLSTGIGSAIAFFAKTANKSFLSISLGFSAGVMIYVSLVEIFAKARNSLSLHFGDSLGYVYTVIGFFIGILVILIIDRLIPSYENPHEARTVEEMNEDAEKSKKLKRMGVLTALAIGIHNFPEGIATFTAALTEPKLGVSIAVAIAIHNIPEGIAVSVPLYFSTKSRKKAFWYSFTSGLAEPVGAIVGFFLLRAILDDSTFGFVFAAVAGIMVFISIDELLPTAREYDTGHKSIYGLVAGMFVMATSLLLFLF
ncbi:MAG TPA: zinc transporter ZupT [Candidatus Kapabacteria bacterium]|nr:zinc transporter ZupT [Candidatus Kapabacteria bacterium]